jgi:hypothetical protein
MSTTESNMGKLLKILFKIQKYMYSNYKNITSCLNKDSYRTYLRTPSNLKIV